MPLTICNFSLNSQRRAGSGKFVLLMEIANPENAIIVFSDFSHDSQHRDIVAHWERVSFSSVAAAGLRVSGGGWWRWREGDELCLFGYSALYGSFNRDWLSSRLVPGQVFDEAKISFE